MSWTLRKELRRSVPIVLAMGFAIGLPLLFLFYYVNEHQFPRCNGTSIKGIISPGHHYNLRCSYEGVNRTDRKRTRVSLNQGEDWKRILVVNEIVDLEFEWRNDHEVWITLVDPRSSIPDLDVQLTEWKSVKIHYEGFDNESQPGK